VRRSPRQLGFLIAAAVGLFSVFATAKDSASQSAPSSGTTWRFAVSGDSRNCGDIVMPAIAESARHQGVRFYWHLGDFRAGSHVDEDIAQRPEYKSRTLSEDQYLKLEWQDFIDNQLTPFGSIPVFLGIGNHENHGHTRVGGSYAENRADYVKTFRRWLDADPIREARQADAPGDSTVKPYYHWTEQGIDFVTLDNATDDQFDDEQMKWVRKVLARDESDPQVQTIVLGMHKALPDSISYAHSMSEAMNVTSISSGREVYRELLKAQDEAHKHVYIIASHSHFFMDNTFNTTFWKSNGGVLPGWIVGTAGAQRYMLPEGWRQSALAIQHAYGYLLGTVNPRAWEGERPDGTIRFEFKLLNKSDVPHEVEQRFSPALVDFCFDGNASTKPL
jgi:Calcineurin-like phosphoesterase